jgi:hypothetical protein
MSTQTDTKPNGPAAAVVLAAGVGSFTLGLMVVVAEMAIKIGDTTSKAILDFSKNYSFLPAGVGPLSGKTIVAVIAFVVAWIVFHFMWRGKEVDFNRAFAVAIILVALGFAMTFPPIFLLFEPKE